MDDHNDDLETLGERLYSLIYPKHKDNAGKLTGEATEAWHHFHSHKKHIRCSQQSTKRTILKIQHNRIYSRYAAGAAGSCPESDGSGRGHADCSFGESTESPGAGAGAQVQQCSGGSTSKTFISPQYCLQMLQRCSTESKMILYEAKVVMRRSFVILPSHDLCVRRAGVRKPDSVDYTSNDNNNNSFILDSDQSDFIALQRGTLQRWGWCVLWLLGWAAVWVGGFLQHWTLTENHR